MFKLRRNAIALGLDFLSCTILSPTEGAGVGFLLILYQVQAGVNDCFWQWPPAAEVDALVPVDVNITSCFWGKSTAHASGGTSHPPTKLDIMTHPVARQAFENQDPKG